MNIKRFFRFFLDYIFPRYCSICGKFLSVNSEYLYLCENCVDRFSFLEKNICSICGNILPQEISSNLSICPQCQKCPPVFLSARSAVFFDPSSKKIIYEFKYHQGDFLGRDIAKLALRSDEFKKLITKAALVPVPLHWRRKFFRGYNQSEVFANELCKLNIHSKVLPLLTRIRYTKPQVSLAAEQRQNNVNHAFKFNKKYTSLDRNLKVVIIDDVFTTGSTLSQCAMALKENGFKNIHVATFARTKNL